jgi:hypothetical protein
MPADQPPPDAWALMAVVVRALGGPDRAATRPIMVEAQLAAMPLGGACFRGGLLVRGGNRCEWGNGLPELSHRWARKRAAGGRSTGTSIPKPAGRCKVLGAAF